jgi:hypothetical protein
MFKKSMIVVLIAMTAIGCTPLMPPEKVTEDRQAYIRALGESWKEQLLYNLVMLKYGEPPSFLDITNIVTDYTLDTSASVGYQHSWGTAIGNDLSLGTAARYSTNPTITYAPVSGETIKTILIRPIPVAEIFRALETGWYPEFILSYCTQSINHLQNGLSDENFYALVELWIKLAELKVIHVTIDKKEAEKLADKEYPEQETRLKKGSKIEQAFGDDKLIGNLVTFTSKLVQEQKKKTEPEDDKSEVIHLSFDMERAKEQGVLQQVEEFEKTLGLVTINNAAEKYIMDLKTNKDLNWLDSDKTRKIIEGQPNETVNDLKNKGFSQKQISALSRYVATEDRFEVVYGYPDKETEFKNKIYVQTKSVLQALLIASEFIDIPNTDKQKVPGEDKNSEEKKAKKKAYFKKMKDMGVAIEIKSSTHQPSDDDTYVSIQHGGNWFFIPNSPSDSKDSFTSIIGILSMLETSKKEPPVLTLPVR